jgi:hypothetical protein
MSTTAERSNRREMGAWFMYCAVYVDALLKVLSQIVQLIRVEAGQSMSVTRRVE